MIVVEFKVKGKTTQYAAIDEAIRTAQFVRYQFRKWLEYFGVKFGKITVAVNPAYTTQQCSNYGAVVKKSLSTRTSCNS